MTAWKTAGTGKRTKATGSTDSAFSVSNLIQADHTLKEAGQDSRVRLQQARREGRERNKRFTNAAFTIRRAYLDCDGRTADEIVDRIASAVMAFGSVLKDDKWNEECENGHVAIDGAKHFRKTNPKNGVDSWLSTVVINGQEKTYRSAYDVHEGLDAVFITKTPLDWCRSLVESTSTFLHTQLQIAVSALTAAIEGKETDVRNAVRHYAESPKSRIFFEYLGYRLPNLVLELNGVSHVYRVECGWCKRFETLDQVHVVDVTDDDIFASLHPEKKQAEQTDGATPIDPVTDPDWTADFTWVRWNKSEYVFTKSQAACVKLMVETWQNGKPILSQVEILTVTESNADCLRRVFLSTKNGKKVLHTAWRTMIIPVSGRKGAYRVAEPSSTGAPKVP